MSRPRVMPGLLADVVAAAPARVVKRLDAAPGVADGWMWQVEGEGWLVLAGEERVALAGGVIESLDQVACGCLVAPRCLHVLAILSALPLATPDDRADEPQPVAGDPPSGGPQHAGAEPRAGVDAAGRTSQLVAAGNGGMAGDGGVAAVVLSRGQGEAVRLAWEAGAAVLGSGAAHAGAAVRQRLLRAAHACAKEELPRAARLATAVAQAVRDLAVDSPDFALDRYADDLAELLGVAWRLGREPRVEDVGEGRRAFHPLPPMVLRGLCCEPVVTASGYAGVVTHLYGDRLYLVADVRPGSHERIGQAYRTGVSFGGLALSHERLARTRVYAQGAAASADGRLSGGKGTTAAAQGPSEWDDLAHLWDDPPESELLFLHTTVDGRTLHAGSPLQAVGATAVGERNLRRLHGRTARLIVKVVAERPGTVTVLAADGADLSFADLDGPLGPELPPVVASPPSPLLPLTRALHRYALGGAATVGPIAAERLAVAQARLRRDQFPTAADLLARLRAGDGDRARAWLAGMIYARHASRALW